MAQAQDITLYWGSGSPPCWRVLIALHEKQLEGFDSRLLSFEKNEHKGDEVQALNPRAQLPTMKHGETVVNESFAACLYLESVFKSQGTPLIPEDPAEMALVYQRMFETNNLQQRLYEVAFYDWLVPEAERLDAALSRNREALLKELQLWEKYLETMGKGSYLAGKDFSMADVVCFPVIAFLPRLGCPRERCPRLMDYHNMLLERPSIKASWPPTWSQTPEGPGKLKDL